MILIDTNVLIDITTRDPRWLAWSRDQFERALANDQAAINVMVYTELARDFDSLVDVDAILPLNVRRLDLPFSAAAPANRAFVEYRKKGGTRTSPLVDFFIGAHAEVAGLTLLTRDAARYRTYFPNVRLITPDDTNS